MSQYGKPIGIGTIGAQPKEIRVRKKITMKRRFKRWLINWLNNDEAEESMPQVQRIRESEDLESNSPMRLLIHRAAGGLVVETRTYDKHKDRSHQNLHIVTHEQDLSESLSKIITMESMRQ